MNGLIIKATGSWYKARLSDKSVVDCRLPGKFRLSDEKITNPVAVGDNVRISMQSDGSGMITEILERSNKLLRKATHGRQGVQILASNVDQVLIVQSLKQPVFKNGFIDRLLVCCEAYEITPVILINKTDLAKNNKDIKSLEQAESLYSALGYSILRTSIHDDSTPEALKSLIDGKISVLTGPSGTGKTSLLNRLSPGLHLKTGDVSSFSNKGKHTTTYAQLIEIYEDTYIVDTPGIREFGLVDLEIYEISLFFPEMRSFRESCKYYNCTHRHEPDCAVKQAVEDEKITSTRYRSYVNILESIESEMP